MSLNSKLSKSYVCLSLFCAILAVFSAGEAYAYSGGKGEPNAPYRIATAEDLNDIGNHIEDFNKHFIMVNDINLADYTGEQFNIIGREFWDPFTGVFDGNGHAIRNFSWSYGGPDYVRNVGVFGVIGVGGVIKNVTLKNVNVNAGVASMFVGSLAGFNDFGDLINCHSIGNVNGGNRVGGLVGYSWEGTISTSSSAGITSANDAVGGLLGINWESPVVSCHSTADVSGNTSVGGLVGSSDWTISGCHATGHVSGYSGIGGLVGSSGGPVIECYSSGSVSATTSGAGGLVGKNWWHIYNSYSSGSVAGNHDIGGLAGYHNSKWGGEISKCYSVGSVSGNSYTGGLIGKSIEGIVEESFWDVNTTGEPNSAGGTGKTTAEMQDANTYMDAGWDFNTPIWKFCSLPDYPKLAWQACPGPVGPVEMLVELGEMVEELGLGEGVENSLLAKLQAAGGVLEDDNEKNDGAAVNILGAFINAASAQSGKKIPESQADALIAEAAAIIESLESP